MTDYLPGILALIGFVGYFWLAGRFAGYCESGALHFQGLRYKLF